MKKHLIIASLIAAALAAGLAYLSLHVDLLPRPFSAERDQIDSLLKILFSIASIFFAIIITFFVYTLVFFRRRSGEAGEGLPFKGFAPLERAWTLVPLVIVLVLAAYGGIVLNNMTRPGLAQSELEVDVTAQRYVWQFSYPAYNISSYELYTVVNQRLHLRLQSKDVVHSFWVQEWGPKQDAVPGLTTEIRYTPNKTGQYLVQCSQLCGANHTYMTASAVVASSADFQKWVTSQNANVAPGQSQTPAASPTPSTSAMDQITLNLVAENIAFNITSFTASAGANVILNFTNKDSGVPHNFSLYTDSTANVSLFTGKLITGPDSTIYRFKAPGNPGKYFFRCDVHPEMMTGTLVVQ
jgi:cytochrome c oxidase subunit II